MKIAGGLQENGIVVGNAYDKYGSNNALVRWIMQGFARTLDELVDQAQPRSIHEIGCGEGYWVLQWTARGDRGQRQRFFRTGHRPGPRKCCGAAGYGRHFHRAQHL